MELEKGFGWELGDVQRAMLSTYRVGWWAELGVAVRVKGRVRDSNLRLVTRARVWGGV